MKSLNLTPPSIINESLLQDRHVSIDDGKMYLYTKPPEITLLPDLYVFLNHIGISHNYLKDLAPYQLTDIVIKNDTYFKWRFQKDYFTGRWFNYSSYYNTDGDLIYNGWVLFQNAKLLNEECKVNLRLVSRVENFTSSVNNLKYSFRLDTNLNVKVRSKDLKLAITYRLNSVSDLNNLRNKIKQLPQLKKKIITLDNIYSIIVEEFKNLSGIITFDTKGFVVA